MTERQPRTTELDQRFSSPEARATPWDDARSTLTDAKIYWLSTIRDDLRPHVTPLIGLFIDDTFVFCTGPAEQKAKNIVQNANCSVTTGCNTYDSGLDIVVEGSVERVVEEARLRELARGLRRQVRRRLAVRGRRRGVPPRRWRGMGVRSRADGGVRVPEGRRTRPDALAVQLISLPSGRYVCQWP